MGHPSMSRPLTLPAYAPLRVHGVHSLLAGVDTPAELLACARELGLGALALTDVDTLCGSVEFLQAARAQPQPQAVRPILGAEITSPTDEERRLQPGDASRDERPFLGRAIALVENETGWRHLCKLVTARQLGDDPALARAPLAATSQEAAQRFDLVQSAERFAAGLVFLVDQPRLLVELACRLAPGQLFAALSPASLLPRRFARAPSPPTPLAPAEVEPSSAASAFDAPKTPPPAPPADARELIAAARSLGVPLVGVPDVYCARAAGFVQHRARSAVRHNALLEDLPEAWLAAAPAHLLSAARMREIYGEFPGALERSLEIAERCAWTPPLGGILFPRIELEAGESPYSRLAALAFEGARARYRPLRPEVVRRLDYELATLERLGFAPYFLLVKQIADFARARAIPCVGRGSAADSLVAYCLTLTDADPLRYRLPFERFLNPARRDRPDIDLDFCWRRRDEVLEHVYQAFGPERTAMISTLCGFGLRAAFREAALVHGLPPAEINRWSRRLPWIESNADGHGEFAPAAFDGTVAEGAELAEGAGTAARRGARDHPLLTALRRTPECRAFPFQDPRWQRALDSAAALVDTPRHHGLHPGGVVVAPGPITDYVSLLRSAKGLVATQLDKDGVEAVGLVKIDLLGNRALTTIDDCVRALAERRIHVDWERVPENDASTARVLREGRTLGCFQIESPGMRNLLQQIGAADMDAVIQAVALIRPGPAGSGMKDAYVRRVRGIEERRAPHPRLTELLWDAQGVLLYQEDVMQAAALLAGWELPAADQLRRTLQKRRGHELEQERARFLAAAVANGVGADEAQAVWERIANFASFAFCKAHAVTYGRIAYRAAWLKTHHPAAFLCAFLASETGYYDARVYVEEARRLGTPILGPDVNRSQAGFTLEWLEPGSGGARAALRVGLQQIKGFSQASLQRLLDSRARHGPFLSLPDVLERTQAHTDELTRLIQCGALDSFDRTRPEMLWRLHLLRAGPRAVPRGLERELGAKLDRAQLAACRETPASRARRDALRAGGAGLAADGGGWGKHGLGVSGAQLARGQEASLFGAPDTPAVALPALQEFDRTTRGRLEYEILGLTLSAHPTALFPCEGHARWQQRARANRRGPRPGQPTPCQHLDRYAGGRITLHGWTAATRRAMTQAGEWMRFLTLEDESGLAEVVLFPDVYRRDGHLLGSSGPHLITGLVEDHFGALTLRAERVW